MIGGVVVLAGTGHIPYAPLPGDDASGTPVTATGGRHRVFGVVAARALWQVALEVAEGGAVLAGMGKRSAGIDQLDRLGRLARQRGQLDVRDVVVVVSRAGRRGQGHRA